MFFKGIVKSFKNIIRIVIINFSVFFVTGFGGFFYILEELWCNIKYEN